MLAIPWAVVRDFGVRGGSLNATLVASATLLTLVWSLYSGTLIDRLSRRAIFLRLNALGAFVLCAAGGLAYGLGGPPFGLLAVVFTGTMFAYATHYPNLNAFTQELLRPNQYQRINAALEIQGQVTHILGMAAGSLLLVGTEAWALLPEVLRWPAQPLHRIFLLNGLSYALAGLVLWGVRYTPKPRPDESAHSVLQRLQTGLRYLWAHPNVLVFGLCAYAVFFGALVLIQVLLPVYVQHVLSGQATTMALAQGALALGAVIAAWFTVRRWRRSAPPAQEVLIALGCAVALIALMATLPSPIVLVLCMLGYGLLNATARVHRVTYIQQQVPNHLLGRVHSSLMFVNYLLRAGVVYVLSIPFFTAEGAGGNVVYGMLGLAGLLAVALIVLALRYRQLVPAVQRS